MLVDKRTNSLVMQVPDPFLLRDLLPQSKTLPHPQYNFAAHHTLEATKILRNIGFDVPAPIRGQYSWPGRFKPYEHQIQMSEFFTLHRRCFNLSEMGCVDADTEYLSSTGWKRIADYEGGDVAQYLPDTGKIEFVDEPEFIKLPCAEMIRVKTKYGLDQLVSPEHRMLLSKYKSPLRWTEMQAQDALAWHDDFVSGGGPGWSNTTIPTTFSWRGGVGLGLSREQLRVQVACIADGTFAAVSTSHCRIRIKKLRKQERLRELLAAAAIEFRETAEAGGYRSFTFYAPWRTKHYDERFYRATTAELRTIVDEAPHWDGTIRQKGAVEFFSFDKRSADFIQFAATATGRNARLFSGDNGYGLCHTVRVRAGGHPLMLCSRSSSGERRRVMWREPSTDGFKYCFRVPSTFLIFRRNGCVFASGNSMKTNSALWASDWLMNTGRVDKALILSPLSTLESVWADDIFDTLPHRTSAILHGTKAKRLKYLGINADYYILNHDGLKIPELAEAIRKRPDISLLCVDEAGMFRNYQSEKYKALAQLIKARPDLRVWLMTGTPCPNAPTDAWALARLVSPERVPQFAGAFQRSTMVKISKFKWVPKHDAYQKAYDAMQPAIRFRKKDCIDLPPVTIQNHGTQPTKEQAAAVKDLKDLAVAQTAQGVQVTAANAADKINKMRQILCGAVKDPATGVYHPLPHGPRLRTLIEAIESASAKVIVVVPFKGIIRLLETEVTKHKHSCEIVNGDVPPAKRAAIFKAFKTQADPHVLLCHPAVMAHGLNLTEADTLIFYAPIYSNDEVEQVNERFNRAGQTRPMTIVRIGAHPLEWEIYKVTDTRSAAQSSILKLYEVAMQ